MMIDNELNAALKHFSVSYSVFAAIGIIFCTSFDMSLSLLQVTAIQEEIKL